MSIAAKQSKRSKQQSWKTILKRWKSRAADGPKWRKTNVIINPENNFFPVIILKQKVFLQLIIIKNWWKVYVKSIRKFMWKVSGYENKQSKSLPNSMTPR